MDIVEKDDEEFEISNDELVLTLTDNLFDVKLSDSAEYHPISHWQSEENEVCVCKKVEEDKTKTDG